MKRLLPFVLCCLILSLFGSSTQAQNKIGYISLQELIPAMPEYKKAEADLADYNKALSDQLADYRKEYDTKDSTYKADSAKWSPAVREVKRQELVELARKLITFQQEAGERLQQKETELLIPIQQKSNFYYTNSCQRKRLCIRAQQRSADCLSARR